MAKKPLKIDAPERVEVIRETREEGAAIREIPQKVKVLGIVGIVLLLVAGIGIFWWMQRAKANEEASIALKRVMPYYTEGEYQKAIEGDPSKVIGTEPVRGLASIVDEYGSTDAGKIAALQLGGAYLIAERFDDAAKAYDVAVEAGDPTIRAAALAGQAAVAEAQGNYPEAAEHYASAADELPYDFKKADYLLDAARNYEQANQKDKAVELYREIATKYAATTANRHARLALARNNVEL